ncbi:LOW QUALITY PROTEIN: toll-interacting protein-like [Pollicipes pollicipes]|uniref:LOW QUALITY PROTEIN: toll-interacting protein-like n=1 Tax=Pollicipes pollicipes TaxID=41117 RepID=UPI001885151B|nr:LOW QUALITY PROTEIN: toll-interacting protein-like [Pollicipes pollicipes]
MLAITYKKAFISELPSDFLCPDGEPAAPAGGPAAPGAGSQQEEMDRQAALALQRHYSRRAPTMQTAAGRLNLTIAQAKLTKNYGLTRMDPYVRLRLGHCVYETQTCYNGATNPRWNKAVMCYVPHGVTSLHLEVYDECSFTTDDQLVAQATIQIPESVLQGGETSDDWHPLSGKQGEGKMGMINLIMNYTPLTGEMPMPAPGSVPMMMAPQAYLGLMPTIGVPMYAAPPPQQPAHPQPQPQQPAVKPEDVAQEMFPAMDDEIIRSVLETRGGDKSAAISSLLELTAT